MPIKWTGRIVLSAAVFMGVLHSVTGAAAERVSPRPDMERVEQPMRGGEAVRALGLRLSEAAALNRLPTEKLRQILETDPTAWLDRDMRLFFVEEPEPYPASSQVEPLLQAPPENVLTLHSKRGSSRVIYLDFDGHVATNTQWNTKAGIDPIVADPYDRDGVPASFSSSELSAVYDIWRRVSEDYAPFDVDVTTEEPPAAAITRTDVTDTTYGTHVVITRNTFLSCGCGGIAYLGIFDSTSVRHKPAWVFYDSLGSSKSIAEAASHEVGHNLGLVHDGRPGDTYYDGHGSGETGWAPIMGGSYYQNLTQFSKGEYPSANSSQDDLAIMASRGIPMRGDDFGHTAPNAGLASVSNGSYFSVNQSGLIETNDDKDAFTFQTDAGWAHLAINHAYAGNLDVNAELYDEFNNLVVSSNPPDDLDARIDALLPAGTYHLVVTNSGRAPPASNPNDYGYSDYASLGWYQVTGTFGAQEDTPPVVSLSASTTSGVVPLNVFLDGSGSHDPDGTALTYSWKIGESILGTGETFSTVLTDIGEYTVTLTVTSGGVSVSESVVIHVAVCPSTPLPSCISMEKGSLKLKHVQTPEKTKLVFSAEGNTSSAVFGDPALHTGPGNGFCMYDGNDSLLIELYVEPAGADARGKPYWKSRPGVARYSRRGGNRSGVTKIGQSTRTNGYVRWRAGGVRLELPELLLSTNTVVVQSVATGHGCAEITFAPGDIKPQKHPMDAWGAVRK